MPDSCPVLSGYCPVSGWVVIKSLGSVLNQAIEDTLSDETKKRAPKSTHQAAKMMGIGSTIISAAKAIAKVSPETIEDIKNGHITITEATQKLKSEGVLTPGKFIVFTPGIITMNHDNS